MPRRLTGRSVPEALVADQAPLTCGQPSRRAMTPGIQELRQGHAPGGETQRIISQQIHDL